MKTYIKLYRSVTEHPLLSNDNNAYIVFTKLLMKVDWQTGELTTGRFKMAELTNLNPNTVYVTLKRLEKAKMITQDSNNRFTKILVVNWKKYQSDNNKPNNKITTRQQLDNTLSKNKEVRSKEEKEIYKEKEFLTKEQLINLKKKFNNKDIQGEYDKAKDWLQAEGKRKKDYQAFFRNWLRNSKDTVSVNTNNTSINLPTLSEEEHKKSKAKLKEMRSKFKIKEV